MSKSCSMHWAVQSYPVDTCRVCICIYFVCVLQNISKMFTFADFARIPRFAPHPCQTPSLHLSSPGLGHYVFDECNLGKPTFLVTAHMTKKTIQG